MAVQRYTPPAQVGCALVHRGRERGETKAVKIDARKQTIIMKSQDQSLPVNMCSISNSYDIACGRGGDDN